MLIQPTALRDFVTELFTRAGATGAVAGEVAEHLVEANLKGHDSHGVGMIPAYVGNIKCGAPRRPGTCQCDPRLRRGGAGRWPPWVRPGRWS